MKGNFSPSVNIERDFGKKMPYIPTENAINAFNRIFGNQINATKSYCLIGTYGTGKSAFLLATIEFFKGTNSHFQLPKSQSKNTEFLYFQGEYASLVEHFADKLDSASENPKAILNAVEKKAEALSKNQSELVIVLDEFGKFLEFASNHNPEKELYFVQQLAELANDSSRNITFVTTLHQGFDAYGQSLNESQVQEWEKVKGRLIEIPFNEPVEQLLKLAGNYLAENHASFQSVSNVGKTIKIVEQAQVFPLRSKLDAKFAKQLAPFDVLSAGVLAKALQKYGQNERSLFTFLESDANYGLRHYDLSNPYYNLRNGE
jgi:hypothetical protein